MLGHKSPGVLVAEIKMLRTSHKGAFLILEGKDDIRFWRSRRHHTCHLIDGEGKPNVVGAVQRLDAARFAGALAVVDSDFEQVTGRRFESSNLLRTDAHDLECLLCRSSALDKVLAEYGDPGKVRRFESVGIDVRAALVERAMVFGRLRLAAHLARPALELRVQIPRFVDEDTWTVDDAALMRHAVPGSPRDVEAVANHLGRLPEVDP